MLFLPFKKANELKIMKKILLLALFLFGSFLAVNGYVNNQNNPSEKIKIAACPTFHYLLDKIAHDENIEVIKTSSTSENIYYLLFEEIDAFISGRKLKPEEPSLRYDIVGEGFAFLGKTEQIIFYDELNNYEYFTDQEVKKIIDKFSDLEAAKIKKVDDVYSYVEDGIIITSFENTNYLKAKIVHIYSKEGQRHRFSRTPAVYYSFGLKDNDIKDIKAILTQ